MVSERVYLDARGVSLGTVRQAHALKKLLDKLSPGLDIQIRYVEQFMSPKLGSGDRAFFKAIQENPVLARIYHFGPVHKIVRSLGKYNSSMDKYVEAVRHEPNANYVLFHDTIAFALSNKRVLENIFNSVVVNDVIPRPDHYSLKGVKHWVLPNSNDYSIRLELGKKMSAGTFGFSYGFLTDPMFSQDIGNHPKKRKNGSINVTFAFSGGGIDTESLRQILDSFAPKIKKDEIRLAIACSTADAYQFCCAYFDKLETHGFGTSTYDSINNSTKLFEKARIVNLLWREETEDLSRLVMADGTFMDVQYSAIAKSDALFVATPSELVLPNFKIPIYFGPNKRGEHEAKNAVYAVHEGYAKSIDSLVGVGSQIVFDSKNNALMMMHEKSLQRSNTSDETARKILKIFNL